MPSRAETGETCTHASRHQERARQTPGIWVYAFTTRRKRHTNVAGERSARAKSSTPDHHEHSEKSRNQDRGTHCNEWSNGKHQAWHENWKHDTNAVRRQKENIRAGIDAGGIKSQNGSRADVDERDSQHSAADAAQKWTFAKTEVHSCAEQIKQHTDRWETTTDQVSWNTRRVCRNIQCTMTSLVVEEATTSQHWRNPKLAKMQPRNTQGMRGITQYRAGLLKSLITGATTTCPDIVQLRQHHDSSASCVQTTRRDVGPLVV